MIVDSHVHILPASMRDARDRLAELDPWFDLCHRGGRVDPHRRRAAGDDGCDRDRPLGVLRLAVRRPGALRRGQRSPHRGAARARRPAHLLRDGEPGAAGRRGRAAPLRRRGFARHRRAERRRAGLRPRAARRSTRSRQRASTSAIPMVLHCSEPVGHDYPGKGTATPGRVAGLRDAPSRSASRLRASRRRAAVLRAHAGGGASCAAGSGSTPRPGRSSTRRAAYRAVADLCGADRLLFGSDHPLLPARRYIDAFAQAELTAAERALVMGDNAMRTAWSVTTCRSRYTSVSQHRRLRSGALRTLCSGGETGARQPVLRLFRDQDWGLRPPSVVAPTLR